MQQPVLLFLAGLLTLLAHAHADSPTQKPQRGNKPSTESMPDSSAVEWEPIYPESLMPVPPEADDEYIEDDHLYQVRRPHMAYFRSAIGAAPRPLVVVCPGGGYSLLSIKKEGLDIARWFNSIGVDAVVLKYRLKEFGYPAPLQDVARAVRILRSSAVERGIDPARIGVMGFSAGGHAAGMLTTLWDSPDNRVGDALDAISARPDFSMLIYPVLTMDDPHAHGGSRENLLGKNPSPELLQKVSIEKNVRPDTPPVFLMHTAEDQSVPAENSLRMATALLANDVPVALHLYTGGQHGIGMLPGNGPASEWPQALAAWLVEQGIVTRD